MTIRGSVSVVLCAYNAEATIAEQLDALAGQRTDRVWDLTVVDNRCTDRTVEVVRSSRAANAVSLQIVPAMRSQGVAYARNVGFAASRGDLVLICDADDRVTPTWIAEMAEALDMCDVVGGHLDVDELNSHVARGRRGSPTASGLPDAFGITRYAVGANWGGRRSAIEALGGWDSRYTRCGDDVDIGIRAALRGFSIGFAPAAIVHYRLRMERGAAARQRYHYTVVSMELRHRYRAHVTKPAEPPLRRQVPWLIWTGLRYPWLRDHDRNHLHMVTALVAGRLFGGISARLPSLPSRSVRVRGGSPGHRGP